ncbi:MAG: hypothetical protein P4L34_04925 [Paludibacter sp.]|nr:hypothetical protein [Paludibacter sp.]
MKKKNAKKSIEEAVEAVNNLKASVQISSEKGQDTSAIKALETSVRKIEKLEKEVVALKDRLRNKKSDLNQERTVMLELAQTVKKMLKNKPLKKEKSIKKGKKQKVEKVETPEETK